MGKRKKGVEMIETIDKSKDNQLEDNQLKSCHPIWIIVLMKYKKTRANNWPRGAEKLVKIAENEKA